MDEIRCSGRFGLGWNLGPQQCDLNNCERCMGKCVCIGHVFGHFWDLMGAPGGTDVWPGLPGCR